MGALGCDTPKNLYEAKDLVGVVFDASAPKERRLVSDASFRSSNIRKATFIGCDLAGVSFQNARIGRVRFIECRPGAQFDSNPHFADDAEVTLVRKLGGSEETFVGADISRAFAVLSGKEVRGSFPQRMGRAALIVVLSSLLKRDKHTHDYPERRKIENRLRAWLSQFNLNELQLKKHLAVSIELFEDLLREAWIARNPARDRTFVPAPTKDREIRAIVRSEIIPTHLDKLEGLARTYDARLKAIG